MHGYGIRTHLQRLLDRGDEDLAVAVDPYVGRGREMEDETDIMTGGPVSLGNDTFVHEDGCCASLHDIADGLLHIDETRYGAHTDTVVHGHDYRVPAFPVYDPFHSDVLSEHFYYRATC